MNVKIQENESVFDVTAVFDNEVERDEFVAQFPKWVGVKSTQLYSVNQGAKPIAFFQVWLMKTNVTGEVNEAGLKRIAKFKDVFAKFQNEKG